MLTKTVKGALDALQSAAHGAASKSSAHIPTIHCLAIEDLLSNHALTPFRKF
jgi:hypothetical protein